MEFTEVMNRLLISPAGVLYVTSGGSADPFINPENYHVVNIREEDLGKAGLDPFLDTLVLGDDVHHIEALWRLEGYMNQLKYVLVRPNSGADIVKMFLRGRNFRVIIEEDVLLLEKGSPLPVSEYAGVDPVSKFWLP